MSFVIDSTVLRLEIEMQATEVSTQLKISYTCELAGRIFMFQEFRLCTVEVQRFSPVTCRLNSLDSMCPALYP